jgi:hypothetical protein
MWTSQGTWKNCCPGHRSDNPVDFLTITRGNPIVAQEEMKCAKTSSFSLGASKDTFYIFILFRAIFYIIYCFMTF